MKNNNIIITIINMATQSNIETTTSKFGTITTIIGPMFCGKTKELTRLIDRKRIADKKCLIIKHSKDNRFDADNKGLAHITTHCGSSYDKCDIVRYNTIDNDKVFASIISKYDVVGIDEGFFFKGICNFCNRLANNGIEVIVSTLDSSYKQQLFSEIGDLIAISEHVIKLTAVCKLCKSENGSFTIRTIDNNEEILVGSDDIYKSVCRSCLCAFNK